MGKTSIYVIWCVFVFFCDNVSRNFVNCCQYGAVFVYWLYVVHHASSSLTPIHLRLFVLRNSTCLMKKATDI